MSMLVTTKFNLVRLAAAIFLLSGVQGCLITPGFAQNTGVQTASAQADQTTGVSHPEDLRNDVNSPQPAPAASEHYVKPSAAIPMPADIPDNSAADTYRPYRPTLATRAPITTSEDSEDLDGRSRVVTDDINSGIVMEVPVGPNELPIGTVLKAELQDPISTAETRAGSRFTATLTADVSHHHVVLLPAGAIIAGRITSIRGGHAIGGPAAIRLQPDTVSLPDGTSYRLNAEVIDLDHAADSHVNSEGTIVDNSHTKATLAVLGGTTGVAAVSGAAVGGPVGAAVGAGIGAGIGTVWWLRRDRQETLPQGTSIVFSLDNSLQLTPAKD
jgi:hypothetical protein